MTIREHLETITATTANTTSARISAKRVDESTFNMWNVTLQRAHYVFYRYQYALIEARNGKSEVSEDLRTDCANVIRDLLSQIGEVSGRKLRMNPAMVESLTATVIRDRKTATGENADLTEAMRAIRKELKTANGARPEWIKERTEKLETLQERAKEVRKQENSCEHYTVRRKEADFICTLELELSKIVRNQSAKTLAELEAEEKALKAARKARNAKKAKKPALEEVGEALVKNN